MESIFVLSLIASGVSVSAATIDTNNSKMGQYKDQVQMRPNSKDSKNEEFQTLKAYQDKTSKKRI